MTSIDKPTHFDRRPTIQYWYSNCSCSSGGGSSIYQLAAHTHTHTQTNTRPVASCNHPSRLFPRTVDLQQVVERSQRPVARPASVERTRTNQRRRNRIGVRRSITFRSPARLRYNTVLCFRLSAKILQCLLILMAVFNLLLVRHLVTDTVLVTSPRRRPPK